MKQPIVFSILFLLVRNVSAQEETPVYLKDRGTGLPTSMFGTYIGKGDLYVYPFYEYYLNADEEYAPNEFGGTSDTDIRGRYTAHEGLLFLGYGISRRLAVEVEAAYIDARLEKAIDDPEDPSGVVEESGIGDVEAQLRYRWNFESVRAPEFFSYFETVFPTQASKDLIGTPDWELKLGMGAIKGFSWGTVTLRASVQYSAEEEVLEQGEFALEYLKRISPFFRFYLGIEGTQDEVEFIADTQWHVNDAMFIRVNSSFGLTSKAVDFAPELGLVMKF
jgi:hypothetical protein